MRHNRTIRWLDLAAQAVIGATAVGAVCMALAGARPEPETLRHRAAMDAYQARQWPLAYEQLAALADDGDAAAARVAAMMARQGPKLFGQRFELSAERLARWERTMRGDTIALAEPAPNRVALASALAMRSSGLRSAPEGAGRLVRPR